MKGWCKKLLYQLRTGGYDAVTEPGPCTLINDDDEKGVGIIDTPDRIQDMAVSPGQGIKLIRLCGCGL
jgi:hypothetical protein